MKNPSVLIIEDDPQIRKLLSITLHSNEYSVLEASSGKEGVSMVASHRPNVTLLDLGLPDENGQEILKHLRTWYSNPIIILSVQSSEEDIVEAIDNGANDYLIKPFRTGELLGRVRSALRNAANAPNLPTTTFKDLSIDYHMKVVKKNSSAINLSATEYSLLSLLIRNEGKVLTNRYLLQQIWGAAHLKQSQYLMVFIDQLRKKVEADSNRPEHIMTEPGVGYRFIG